MAGYSAATRYESLFFLPLLGLNTAIIAIVGQNFGKKQYTRVIETYTKGLYLGIFLLWISALISIYTAIVYFKKSLTILKD